MKGFIILKIKNIYLLAISCNAVCLQHIMRQTFVVILWRLFFIRLQM
jgi:hypothetical protein